MPNTDPNFWFLAQPSMPRAPHFTAGNDVVALVDGAAYMEDLKRTLDATDRSAFVSGWRITSQQYLTPTAAPGLTPFIDGLRGVRARNGEVRALVYNVLGTEFLGPLRKWHGDDNRLFCDGVIADGGEAVLDGRISAKAMSSHHQKFIVARSNNGSGTAYVGGIDVCWDRWDRPAHDSPPERQRDFVAIGQASNYFPSLPAWHDVQAKLVGPAVGQVWDVFKRRWNGVVPENGAGLAQYRRRTTINDAAPAPPAAGGKAVQVLQTLPCGTAYYGAGEQTVRLAHEQAIDRAQHYVYIEDQYLWPCSLVAKLEAALQRGVHVVVLVARDYDLPGMSYVHKMLRQEVATKLHNAGGDRFGLYHLEQPGGTQIYVHAKTMIVDDCWASIGSANFNARSLTNDTELQVAIVDSDIVHVPFGGNILAPTPVCRFAHEYRCRLWAEHFGVPSVTMVDPLIAIRTFWTNAPVPPLSRVKKHLPAPSAADYDAIADFLISLLILGAQAPGFLAPVLVQPATEIARPILRPLISQLMQQGQLAAATNYLKEVLNPTLVC